MENNLSIVKDQFKELPNNIEAEQAVIGSIIVNIFFVNKYFFQNLLCKFNTFLFA